MLSQRDRSCDEGMERIRLPFTLVAMEGINGLVASGQVFETINDATVALIEKAQAVRSSPNAQDGDTFYTVSERWDDRYPADRRLTGRESPGELGDTFARVAREHTEALVASGALVSSGGVPGPPTPDYRQIAFGTAARPVRDGLPSVLAPRGELAFNVSPVLDEILVDQSGAAIDTVTASEELVGSTKSVQELSAPTSSTAVVRALPMRFQTGNFSDRFFPGTAARVSASR
jgi:hypothetical protein